MEKEIYKVNPIVIYPPCMENGGVQMDCHTCSNKNECMLYQPRCMCIKPYKGHKNGCPNFGKLPTCPPDNPCLYDWIFDISDVYAIVTRTDLYRHYEKMRTNNPNLAEGQVRNKMYWQHTDKKNNDIAISEFYRENPDLIDYIATRNLECMGVDVVGTMANVGLDIKFPVDEFAYRVAFAAKVDEKALEKYEFMVYTDTSKEKKGMKTLVKKR